MMTSLRLSVCLLTIVYCSAIIHVAKHVTNEKCKDISFRNMTGIEVPQYCKSNQCGGMVYTDIIKLYKGMFLSKSQIKIAKRKYLKRKGCKERPNKWWRNKKYTKGSCDAYSDWDKCCATTQTFVQFPSHMKNKDGVNRALVHMPDRQPEPLYQAGHLGVCAGGGDCSNCQQKTRFVTLLVIDPAPTYFPPLMFDTFEISSYCACVDYGH